MSVFYLFLSLFCRALPSLFKRWSRCRTLEPSWQVLLNELTVKCTIYSAQWVLASIPAWSDILHRKKGSVCWVWVCQVFDFGLTHPNAFLFFSKTTKPFISRWRLRDERSLRHLKTSHRVSIFRYPPDSLRVATGAWRVVFVVSKVLLIMLLFRTSVHRAQAI